MTEHGSSGRLARRLIVMAWLLALSVAMVLPNGASAQRSPTLDAYSDHGDATSIVMQSPSGEEQGGGGEAPATAPGKRPAPDGATPAAASDADGQLPFTGFQALGAAALGALLLAGGFAVRRTLAEPA